LVFTINVIFALQIEYTWVMNLISKVIHGLIIVLVAGCMGSRQIAELTSMSEVAYQNGDYEKALELAEQIILEVGEKGRTAEGNIYAIAGKSAYQLEAYDKSLDYLIKARQSGYADEAIYVYLSDNYNRIDNLSKEIAVLDEYIQRYPEGKEINTIRARLFQTCQESENFELAEQLWHLLEDESTNRVENLEIYLSINQVQQNDQVCDSIASLILEINPDNESSLSWIANKYYWNAENRYQAEMKAYNENKTRKQYAKLLKAFKIVSNDFKQSLDYYTRLYNLNPKPEYAKYLGNIYARLSDEENAKYYHDKAL
jgi:tetratricopeptide (TPR) repeat protein